MRLEDIYALLKKLEAGQISPSEIQEIREELQTKTEKNLLTYVDGKICTYGGEDVTFNEVYNMLMTEPDFVVLVYNDKAYHPNQVDTDTIIFASTYTNAGHIVTYRILFNSDESVTVSEVTAEKLADKVSEITDSNKDDMTKYASVKAVTGYANSKSEVNARLTNNASKNLLDCSRLFEKTISGVTFTPAYDENGLLEYINVNGTATNDAVYTIYGDWGVSKNDTFEGKKYITLNSNKLTIRIWCYLNDAITNTINPIETVVSNIPNGYDSITIGIRAISSQIYNNEKVYPMIRYADIEDSTYEPYYPTNVELANGSAKDNTKLPLTGGTITGDLSVNGVVNVGGVTLQYDNVDNCLKFNFANNALSALTIEDEVIE